MLSITNSTEREIEVVQDDASNERSFEIEVSEQSGLVHIYVRPMQAGLDPVIVHMCSAPEVAVMREP